jgi:hypothetical protein
LRSPSPSHSDTLSDMTDQNTDERFKLALAGIEAALAKFEMHSLLWTPVPIERLEAEFGSTLWFGGLRDLLKEPKG